MTANARILSAAIQAVSEGVIATDGAGRVTYMNRAAEILMGEDAGECLGKETTELLRFIDLPSGCEAASPIAEALRLGQRIEGVHTAVFAKGRAVPIAESTDLLLDLDGRVTGAVMVFRDISEQRRIEELLRHSHKMESIGRLTGGVAHDFNNLVTVILGFCDQILANYSDPGLVDSVDEIRRAGESAATLIRQLLGISRTQTQSAGIFDCRRVAMEMQQLLQPLLPAAIEFQVRTSSDPALIRAAPGQIEQVLMNLIVNARDAMPQGGALTIDVRNVSVPADLVCRNKTLPAGDYVQIAVMDTGCGMEANTLERIFEPFFTTKEPEKGTGFGLANVLAITSQWNGGVAVESRLGSGSSFVVYFPRVFAIQGPEELDFIPPHLAGGTETILLVEDQPAVLRLIAETLEEIGYSVLAVPDGVAALQLAGKHEGPIHVLLTDVDMPKMNGGALAEKVAAIRPGIKILFMSGLGDTFALPEDVPFIQKPFELEEMTALLRAVIEGRVSGHKRAEPVEVTTTARPR